MDTSTTPTKNLVETFKTWYQDGTIKYLNESQINKLNTYRISYISNPDRHEYAVFEREDNIKNIRLHESLMAQVGRNEVQIFKLKTAGVYPSYPNWARIQEGEKNIYFNRYSLEGSGLTVPVETTGEGEQKAIPIGGLIKVEKSEQGAGYVTPDTQTVVAANTEIRATLSWASQNWYQPVDSDNYFVNSSGLFCCEDTDNYFVNSSGLFYCEDTDNYYESSETLYLEEGLYYEYENNSHDDDDEYRRDYGNFVQSYHGPHGKKNHTAPSDKSLRFGCEIETIADISDVEFCMTAKIFNEQTKWVCEADSSLPAKAYEFISDVFTINTIKEFEDSFNKMNGLVQLGLNQSKGLEKCGGHIHISHPDIPLTFLARRLGWFLPILAGMYPERARGSYSYINKIFKMTNNSCDFNIARQAISYKNQIDTVEVRIFPCPDSLSTLVWRVKLLNLVTSYPTATKLYNAIWKVGSPLNLHILEMYKSIDEIAQKGFKIYIDTDSLGSFSSLKFFQRLTPSQVNLRELAPEAFKIGTEKEKENLKQKRRERRNEAFLGAGTVLGAGTRPVLRPTLTRQEMREFRVNSRNLTELPELPLWNLGNQSRSARIFRGLSTIELNRLKIFKLTWLPEATERLSETTEREFTLWFDNESRGRSIMSIMSSTSELWLGDSDNLTAQARTFRSLTSIERVEFLNYLEANTVFETWPFRPSSSQFSIWVLNRRHQETNSQEYSQLIQDIINNS
jgi:hypothetical protein